MVDANGMLKDCIERFRRMDIARDMEFKGFIPEESCLSYVDPDLFRRAIDNILKNGVEACGGRGVIFVDAVCMDEKWRVEIADDGCGIADDMTDKIFDPFVTTRAKGTGLGLAYTAQVISAHSGSIAVENRPTGGACFKIEIPRDPKTIDLWDGDEVKE
jgi:signal transduction histidine kinase